MKKIIMLIMPCLFFLLQQSAANVLFVPQSELTASTKHADTIQIIMQVINNIHYRGKSLDDELSASLFASYMKNLDPNRSFFLATDVENFAEKYEKTLDDALSQHYINPAFDIFNVYRLRVEQRIEYINAQLKNEFDFELNENYAFNRRQLDWADNIEELNEIWRKRLKNDALNLLLTGKEKTEIKDILKKRYHRIYTDTFQFGSDDVFQIFANAYTTSIDPHTTYFSPRASENFDISMRLSLEGIGAVLRSENDHTTIQKIIPGGPADLSNKLHSEDKIIGVGQGYDGKIIDVIGWRLDDVVDMIRGPKGTVLRLEIISGAGNEYISELVTITRDKIKLEESAAKSDVIKLPGNGSKIGIISIPTFYVDFAAQEKGEPNFKNTSGDVKKLIAELKTQEVAGIIIDLRNNGGGALSEALSTTGLFIQSGPIVQTRNSLGRININNDPDPDLAYAGPLAVLVNRHSASASEIFAGAIQDYRRGIIVGEPTYGKGTVQTIIDLNNLKKDKENNYGKLKTTVQQFFRINGESTQNRGIIPNITFPTIDDINDYGERSLDYSLPWSKIRPVKYNWLGAPIKFYDKIQELHKMRIASDKTFQLLLKQYELIKQNSNRKVISLNKNWREAEHGKLLDAKRELENQIRLSQGLAPLKKDEETTKDDNEDIDSSSDTLLRETAWILHDLIVLPNRVANSLK